VRIYSVFRLFSLWKPGPWKLASLEGWQISHATAHAAVSETLMKVALPSGAPQGTPGAFRECTRSTATAFYAVSEAPIKALT